METMTLGELTDERDQLRERKRQLNAGLKAVDAMLKENEQAMLDALDEQGVEATRVNGVSISISEQVVPTVENWDQVYDYIRQHDAFYLLQRRMNTGPYKELLDMGEELPGVTPFTKRSINMTKRA